KIADSDYATVDEGQLDEVSRPRISRIAEHRKHFAAVEPRRSETPVRGRIVVREIAADLAAAGPLGARYEVELHVISEHRAYPLPVARIEQRSVAYQSRRRHAFGCMLAYGRKLPKPGAAAMQRRLDRRHTKLEHRRDLLDRVLEHVLQDYAAALRG